MPQTTLQLHEHRRWTHGMALERSFGLPRGMLLSNASNRDPVLARALYAAGFDRAMLNQFARVLAVTVRDWIRK